MSEKIQSKFIDFIAQNFMVEKEDIPLDQSLVDEGIIDSFGLIEIFAYLEKEHAITVTEEQKNRTNFGTVSRIVNFIDKQLAKSL